jgi:LPXTG-site transpeptidase (sortase) family protein
MPQRKRTKNFFFSWPTITRLIKSARRIHKHNKSILLGIGVVLILLGLVFQVQTQSLSFEGNIPTQTVVTQNPLKEVFIPSAGIDLPVEETRITDGKWQIGKDGISHLATSSSPGAGGNIILYGHNTNDRLGSLRNVKVGDKILVVTKNNSQFSYVVTKIVTVDPTDINELTDYQGETITMYTCAGFVDSKRLLVKAKRVSDLNLNI